MAAKGNFDAAAKRSSGFTQVVNKLSDNWHPPPRQHIISCITGGLGEIYTKIQSGWQSVEEDYSKCINDEGFFQPHSKVGLLAGRYQVVRVLGRGNSSTIVQAHDTFRPGHYEVAIKILKPQYYALGYQESDLITDLNKADIHNFCGIVRLLNTFTLGPFFCMTFELMQPWPLHQLFKKVSDSRQRLSLIRKVASRMIQILGFLGHQNVVHADLKPENILCSTENVSDGIKVIDFGNAIHCVYEELSLYYDEFELQTMLYRAPEVVLGLAFGQEIDMWSLGCILAELYMGKPLFWAKKREDLLQQMTAIFGLLPTKVYQRAKFFSSFKEFVGQPSALMETHARLRTKLGCVDFKFVSFVQAMLNFDPNERLSVTDAIQHPFLAPELAVKFVLPATSTGSEASSLYSPVDIKPSMYTHAPIGTTDPRTKHLSSLELLRRGTGCGTARQKAIHVVAPFEKSIASTEAVHGARMESKEETHVKHDGVRRETTKTLEKGKRTPSVQLPLPPLIPAAKKDIQSLCELPGPSTLPEVTPVSKLASLHVPKRNGNSGVRDLTGCAETDVAMSKGNGENSQPTRSVKQNLEAVGQRVKSSRSTFIVREARGGKPAEFQKGGCADESDTCNEIEIENSKTFSHGSGGLEVALPHEACPRTVQYRKAMNEITKNVRKLLPTVVTEHGGKGKEPTAHCPQQDLKRGRKAQSGWRKKNVQADSDNAPVATDDSAQRKVKLSLSPLVEEEGPSGSQKILTTRFSSLEQQRSNTLARAYKSLPLNVEKIVSKSNMTESEQDIRQQQGESRRKDDWTPVRRDAERNGGGRRREDLLIYDESDPVCKKQDVTLLESVNAVQVRSAADRSTSPNFIHCQGQKDICRRTMAPAPTTSSGHVGPSTRAMGKRIGKSNILGSEEHKGLDEYTFVAIPRREQTGGRKRNLLCTEHRRVKRSKTKIPVVGSDVPALAAEKSDRSATMTVLKSQQDPSSKFSFSHDEQSVKYETAPSSSLSTVGHMSRRDASRTLPERIEVSHKANEKRSDRSGAAPSRQELASPAQPQPQPQPPPPPPPSSAAKTASKKMSPMVQIQRLFATSPPMSPPDAQQKKIVSDNAQYSTSRDHFLLPGSSVSSSSEEELYSDEVLEDEVMLL